MNNINLSVLEKVFRIMAIDVKNVRSAHSGAGGILSRAGIKHNARQHYAKLTVISNMSTNNAIEQRFPHTG